MQFCVGDLDTGWIVSAIQFGANFQAGLGGGVRDQVDNDFMAQQRAAAPVLGNVTEHAMLDLVPFAGSRREVANVDG